MCAASVCETLRHPTFSLAAQGLLVVVKALHGTRQGLISANLSDATVQLTELGSGVRRHVIAELDDALTLLSTTQPHRRWLHRNAVFPGELFLLLPCIAGL